MTRGTYLPPRPEPQAELRPGQAVAILPGSELYELGYCTGTIVHPGRPVKEFVRDRHPRCPWVTGDFLNDLPAGTADEVLPVVRLDPCGAMGDEFAVRREYFRVLTGGLHN